MAEGEWHGANRSDRTPEPWAAVQRLDAEPQPVDEEGELFEGFESPRPCPDTGSATSRFGRGTTGSGSTGEDTDHRHEKPRTSYGRSTGSSNYPWWS
ncbi:hypothetical protein CDG81_17135 [Actinopolyspora erythraea]|uniref:Uncharacterized protein n=1 Tax=Actinopolyspora erythraea TaxID=414996 RepID=A0A223RV22_9ACTN|nr:hypothetical protein CDG81_17135 [Actinopolyspora erythraea]